MSLGTLGHAILEGPTPVTDGIAECRRILGEATSLVVPARTLGRLAILVAMTGDIDEARSLVAQAKAAQEDLGLTPWMQVGLGYVAARVEMLAGEFGAAGAALRSAVAAARALGDRSILSSVAGALAHVYCAEARWGDALALTEEAEHAAAADDRISQILWRSARARARAALGEFSEAERLARDAVDMASETDMLVHQGDVLLSLAEILSRAGRMVEAHTAAEDALARYEAKGAAPAARVARAWLASTSERDRPE
jgi:ATP/maltotriose-dependent transcriptional regulator MalT